MNVKKFLPLIAAAGLGLVALIIAHSGLGHSKADTGDKSTIKVIVSKENVAPGQQLTADNLVEQSLSSADVPKTAFTQMNDVVGRVTVAPMVAGQPVLQTFLAAPGSLSGLNALVPPGMRAVTIDINESTGLGGMIQPGSRVDLVSILNQGEHDKTCARTIASNVPVVAVGQRLSSVREPNDTGIARTVTLLAKPREAELIRLAALSANTSLMLRGNGDEGPADSRGVTFTELFGGPMTSNMPKLVNQNGPATPVVPVSGPATKPASDQTLASAQHFRHVQMILGDKVTTIEMPDGNSTPDSIDGEDDYTRVEQGYSQH